MESAIGSSSLPNMFQDLSDEEKSSSLGFMELLGVQEFSPLMFDLPILPSSSNVSVPLNQQQPATPNTSSVSSESTEAVNDEQGKTVDQVHQDPSNTDKQLKAKKTRQKRERGARFAFMTKSEVDHLEDGYRWRKYGQKAVKNSPFPRSYYRCTYTSCNVKKHVERSFTDPSVVVTTYEGQHTHPSPVMAHSGPIITPGGGVSNFGDDSAMPESFMSQYYDRLNTLSSLGFHPSKKNNATFHQENPLCNALLSDHGLLQDVVPSHMLKEE